MKDPAFFDNKENLALLATSAEPEKCQEALRQAIHIIDADQKDPPDIKTIVNGYNHLSDDQKTALQQTLALYAGLFDGTLGDWDTTPVSMELIQGAKPCQCRPYPVPHIHKDQFKKS